MAESDNSTERPPSAEQAAVDRYLEHRERMLRYDREYLERLRDAQAAEQAPPEPEQADLPWGHPICDTCRKRVGCGLQQAMKKVDGVKAHSRP